ncbi:MAG: glutamyl-tRNA reductase [Spirochaetes bacterium]|jgi:glutamyl-tRNA reductase|nr:glutamyl-tRNA reductase [Spirochaetota bacterium]
MNIKMQSHKEKKPEIILIGLNHKTAPVEVREKFYLSEDIIPEFLEHAVKSGIEEIVYVSTCNRVSIYFTSTNYRHSTERLLTMLEEYSGIRRDIFEKYLYKKYSRDAVMHLFSVTSSLDSMVIGENEIFGQIKEAYRLSVDLKKTGTILNRLFHQAFSTSKRIKTETGISKNPLSIAYIAVEQARDVLKGLSEKRALMIGAGEMGELILKYLTKNSIKDITVANRSLHNAERIVEEVNKEAHVIPLQELENSVVEMDIIISSISCADYILKSSQIQSIMEKRCFNPIIIIDIAVPRNIDPESVNVRGVHLYNIDDLERIADKNLNNRINEIDLATQIINSDATDFFEWYEGLNMIPVIVKLQDKFDEVRRAEVQKYKRRKLKHLSEKDIALVDELTRQIMAKTLHNPIMALKKYHANRSGSHRDIETIIEEIFKK